MLPFLLTLYGYAQHVVIILLWWIIVAFIIIVWAYMILDFCKPCITRHHEIETIILLHTSYHFIILLGSIIQNVAYKNIFLYGLVLLVCSRTIFFFCTIQKRSFAYESLRSPSRECSTIGMETWGDILYFGASQSSS